MTVISEQAARVNAQIDACEKRLRWAVKRRLTGLAQYLEAKILQLDDKLNDVEFEDRLARKEGRYDPRYPLSA